MKKKEKEARKKGKRLGEARKGQESQERAGEVIYESHSHAECSFGGFMCITLTLYASEARTHCFLLGQIPKRLKRLESGEGTIAEVRSLATKV